MNDSNRPNMSMRRRGFTDAGAGRPSKYDQLVAAGRQGAEDYKWAYETSRMAGEESDRLLRRGQASQ